MPAHARAPPLAAAAIGRPVRARDRDRVRVRVPYPAWFFLNRVCIPLRYPDPNRLANGCL